MTSQTEYEAKFGNSTDFAGLVLFRTDNGTESFGGFSTIIRCIETYTYGGITYNACQWELMGSFFDFHAIIYEYWCRLLRLFRLYNSDYIMFEN